MAFSTTPTSGNDRLRATADNQTINALGGNDWVLSTFNASMLYGGNGHDRLTAMLSLLEPTETDNERKATLFGGNGNDWLTTELTGHVGAEHQANFVVQQFGGSGNDNLYVRSTSTSDQAYSSGLYNIELSGGSGNDNIWIETDGEGSWARNFVDAGSGDDVVYIYNGGNYFGGGGSNEVIAGDGNDVVTVRSYSSFAANGDNTLWGGRGNDRLEATIAGTWGTNELYGQDGDDILIADGAVSDNGGSFIENKVWGGTGDDTIEISARSYGTLAEARNQAHGEAGNDRITAITSVGNGFDTSFTAAETRLYGGSGNDVLTATTIYDFEEGELLTGGARLYGGAGNDSLRVYGGIENILDGGSGRDTLIGGSGADRLVGGGGADRLTGGEGDDAFVFTSVSGARAQTRDAILDFGDGADVIDVSAIDANRGIDGNQSFAFDAGTGVGSLWVQAGSGSTSLVMANTGGPELLVIAVRDSVDREWSAADFVL